jgi:intraflagellar transport protein 172
LLLSTFGILAAGTDRRVVSYTENGRILQQFDYSRDHEEKAFTSAVLDPSGYNAIFGSFDRLVILKKDQSSGKKVAKYQHFKIKLQY